MIRQENAHRVAIVTTTHYPHWYQGKLRSTKHTDKIRGDLALELIQKASRARYHIVVADWKSTRSFRKVLSSIPQAMIVKRTSPKLSPSKRRLIKKASLIPGISVIVLTEPEKVSLVEDCMPDIITPILEKKADIVVPKRNSDLFKETYPTYQYESEKEGNTLYNEELRSHHFLKQHDEDLDMFFGPRAFSNTRNVRSLFMRRYTMRIGNLSFPIPMFDVEIYSETLFFPIIAALQKGLIVKSIDVPFSYPHLQKENEEKASRELFVYKRKVQKMILLIELLHFVSFLERNRGSRIKKKN